MGRNSKVRKQNSNSGMDEQDDMARSLDELIAYDEYCRTIAPKLREMLKEGKSAKDIYQWAQALAAAKAVTLINDVNSKIALAAAKEVLDRGVGKAAETININSRYEELSDEEIEQLLRSKRNDVEDSTQLN